MIRDITIKPALNGYIVKVGCQTVVFDDRAKLLADLKQYLEQPAVVEQHYRTWALNPIEETCPPPPTVGIPVPRDVPVPKTNAATFLAEQPGGDREGQGNQPAQP